MTTITDGVRHRLIITVFSESPLFIWSFVFLYTGKCLAGYNDSYQTPLSIYAFIFFPVNVLLY